MKIIKQAEKYIKWFQGKQLECPCCKQVVEVEPCDNAFNQHIQIFDAAKVIEITCIECRTFTSYGFNTTGERLLNINNKSARSRP